VGLQPQCGHQSSALVRGDALRGFPTTRGIRQIVASTLQAGFFLKEKSAIVRAACRNVSNPPPVNRGRETRQGLLCSGASISDSAEENLVHHLIVAILRIGCRGGLNA